MAEPQKILIVAPYWRDPQHLGSVRVERFLRWLGATGVQLVIVAGGEDGVRRDEPWGTLLTVADPLRIYREPTPAPATARPRSRLLRWLAYALLSPDPGILWARRACKHPLLLEHCRGVDLVLASGFPDSVHVAAASLAQRCNARLVVDLRDGWLDEPMKPLLRHSPLRRWREGRVERRILHQAAAIFVTSNPWRRLLVERLPFTAEKTRVLTNAYPAGCTPDLAAPSPQRPQQRLLTLLYAGRIYTSRAERRIEQLLAPLLAGLRAGTAVRRLLFVGNLGQPELEELASWRPAFAEFGCEIASRAAVPRAAALELMRQADGLLLLSSSHASIPAKLFDYLCAGRPILALCPASSAVAELAPQLRQMFCLDYSRAQAAPGIAAFIAACRDGCPGDLPARFDEAQLRPIFLAALGFAS